MRAIFILLVKDFTYFRRDRTSMLLTFVVPFVMIYIFGLIFGVHHGKGGGGAEAGRLIGGWAMQFLLFALVSSSTSLFHERDFGIYQRLLSGPIPRSTILWSKFLYGTALGLLQLLVLFAACSVLFGLNLGPQLPYLSLVCVFAAVACAAFGMLLASVSRTPEMARGLSTFAILLMSAIGGAWFPVGLMPALMQKVSQLTLVYWSITGFTRAMAAHASLAPLLPPIGILAAMTVLILGVAWWQFRRGAIFE